jgi:hypothetical protein
VGGLLLLNLLASHVYKFRFSLRKSGIILTHAGLILLLIGELVSGLLQEDFQMQLSLKEPTNYSESFLRNELAIIDTTDKETDTVTVIPEKLLTPGGSLQQPSLPFVVKVREYYPNATLEMRPEGDAPMAKAAQLATAGVGPRLIATPIPITYKSNERNLPTAFIELVGADGSLGVWMVSPQLAVDQSFTVGGRSYSISLRVERRYKPFTLTLTELRHDVYPGSDIPRNFSSRVRLQSQDGKEDREVLIYMNNPLRYGGLTFYQYQMDRASNHSVLQVVRNPGWTLPYISCLMMSIGLAIHFCITLSGFISKRFAAKPAKAKSAA